MIEQYPQVEVFYRPVWDKACTLALLYAFAVVVSMTWNVVDISFSPWSRVFAVAVGIGTVLTVLRFLSRRVRANATERGEKIAYIAAVDALKEGKVRS